MIARTRPRPMLSLLMRDITRAFSLKRESKGIPKIEEA
jgi:hypothetical protein